MMVKIPFTGFDAFFLTLERQYLSQGVGGNICHYVFELNHPISTQLLQETILESDLANQLRALRHTKKFSQRPYWVVEKNTPKLKIDSFSSDNIIPEHLLNGTKLCSPPYYSFSINNVEGDKNILIFSWNHLLMDGYGAVQFLISLFGKSKKTPVLTQKQKAPVTFPTFFQAAKAKIFIDKNSLPPVTGIFSLRTKGKPHQKTCIVSFSANETRRVDEAALKAGSTFGRSSYFLACCTISVKKFLEEKGKKITNFWVPIPKDTRKKGSNGPIIGNRLAFVFYRIKKAKMDSVKELVADLNKQMLNQIKIRMPEAYGHLMTYMKWLPHHLYYWLMRRKNGNAIASFLFTVAPDHPTELNQILGSKVSNAFNLPANPPKPGLTFAFMRVNEQLQLMMAYHENVITTTDIQTMIADLKKELLGNHES